MNEERVEALKHFNVKMLNNDLNYLDRDREYILDSMSGIVIAKPLKLSTIKNFIELNLSDFLKYNENKNNKDFIKKYINTLIELDDFFLITKREVDNKKNNRRK